MSLNLSENCVRELQVSCSAVQVPRELNPQPWGSKLFLFASEQFGCSRSV